MWSGGLMTSRTAELAHCRSQANDVEGTKTRNKSIRANKSKFKNRGIYSVIYSILCHYDKLTIKPENKIKSIIGPAIYLLLKGVGSETKILLFRNQRFTLRILYTPCPH